MDHRQTLLELARAVDPRQGVTVPAGWLIEALENVQTGMQPADLTVADLCTRFHRKPSAVREWLERGDFAGAYKLKGRDWRVPAAAVERFQADQPSAGAEKKAPEATGDMRAWRRLRKSGTG